MTRKQHASRPRRESLSKRLGSKAKRIRERDGNRCLYCRAVDGPMHLDHVIPRSQGGADTADNLIVACASCNSRRQDMSLRRYMRYLREQLRWTPKQTMACMRRLRRQLAKQI